MSWWWRTKPRSIIRTVQWFNYFGKLEGKNWNLEDRNQVSSFDLSKIHPIRREYIFSAHSEEDSNIGRLTLNKYLSGKYDTRETESNGRNDKITYEFFGFGNVDAYPICLRTKDTEEIIRTIYLISGSFGGINLEDISAPRCFEIERRLKEICDIPVFHDDQHGTAIITGAAIINALKVAKKEIDKVKIVINGSGAAGISIGRYLMDLGAKNVIFCDRYGVLEEGQEGLNSEQEKLLKISNPDHIKGLLKDALVGADIFVGCSAPNIVTKDMIKSMADKAIVFPLANPVPEISHDDALEAGAYIIGTGSSKYPNQINNVLVFPGIFRGALDVCAKDITKDMMIAASRAIADSIPEKELRPDYIIPLAFDEKVHKKVAEAVAKAARDNGVSRK